MLGFFLVHARNNQRPRDILNSRRFRQQMMELIDKPNRMTTQQRTALITQLFGFLTIDENMSLARLIKQACNLQ